MQNKNFWSLIIFVVTTFAAAKCMAQKDQKNLASERTPDRFGIIFLMGYGSDSFPNDDANFRKLVKACTEANYNVILGKYTSDRDRICKTNDVQMMVDLLVADYHVYKNPKDAEELCRSLESNKNIYAYHLWSDGIAGKLAGRNRDIANVHKWDPDHAVYVGDRSAREIAGLQGADLIGYYDFHWKRQGHFRHLFKALSASRKTGAPFLRYVDAAPGQVGKGNYNRVLYTVSTSIAFGLKGYMYHYTDGFVDKKSWQWKSLGEDLKRVNSEIAPLGPELMKIGIPIAVYSTPVTKTAKDRPVGVDAPSIPNEFQPIPKDFAIQILAGESIVGVFESDAQATKLFFANHNAYQPQSMQLSLKKPCKEIVRFDRQKRRWIEIGEKNGRADFLIKPASGELIRISWK